MKRALAVMLFLMAAPMGLLANQALMADYYFLPGDEVARDNDGVISPSAYTAKPNDPAVFETTPPAGLRVQYWIVSPNGMVARQDSSPEARFDTYSDTLTWADQRAYSGSSPLRVCARFYYVTNSVVFNRGADDVTGSTASINNKCYTDSYALTPNGFSRTGYTFAGWSTVQGGGVAYYNGQTVSGASFGVTENNQTVNLYAVWTPNTHFVSYDLGGGSHGSLHPSSATYDAPVQISDPTRTGYTFTGWKVTDGLNTNTAKYGSDGESWLPLSSASTLCRGANGSTWFKNLNTANGSAVTLTAQWTPKTTAVHFNNYDAQGGVADKTIAYDETLRSISPVPYWPNGSRRFLGYYTGEGGTGECYWDEKGQPQKDKWDRLDAEVDFYAHSESVVYYITYEPNGGSGEAFSVPFTNEFLITLSDGGTFSKVGSEQLGWAELPTLGTPQYALGEQVRFTNRAANFNLYAIWKEYYYVAFDGNGATNEVPMAVQKFAFGESKALSANEYAKIGYTFEGWATNAVAAAMMDISYGDRYVVNNNLATFAGETNTLFASWRPIPYVTAFDASEHSAAIIASSNCIYDVAFPLPVIPYGEGELWKHVGWSNTVANVVYYTNEVTAVSNLCTTAGATNTLVAVWESMVGELSESMDIYNLRWENENPGYPQSWQVVRGVGHDTESCAAQTGLVSGRRFWEMTTTVTNSGTLAFWWKSTGLASLYYYDEQAGRADQERTLAAQSGWTKVSINVEFMLGGGDTCTLHLGPSADNTDAAGTIYIDQMTWTPGESPVEPTDEDARDISGISLEAGVLSLSFTNADERFSYNLRGTNTLSAPLPLWPVLWTTNGVGDITIPLPVLPSQTSFFYYLETTAK